jgi:hypothetical protein
MIDKLRIRTTSASTEDETPESIRRATNYILKMLRIEYEKTGYITDPSTAPKDAHPDTIDLCPEWMKRLSKGREAVALVKDQVRLFVKEV